MATRTASHLNQDHPHIPGVPDRGGLGASRREAYALLFGVLVLAIIALAFWYSATR